MWASKRGNTTIIAEDFKIEGIISATGAVEIRGQIEGEINCTSLLVSRNAHIVGTITAEQVVVDGKVEGPIRGGEVTLKSNAQVFGDIACQSLVVEKGALIEGRLVHLRRSDEPSMLETAQKTELESDKSRRKLERGNAQPKVLLDESVDALH